MAGPWSSCCVGGYSKIFSLYSLCPWNITWTWLRFIRSIHIPYLICRQYIVFSVMVLHLFSLVVGKSSTYASKNPTSIQFDIGYTWFNHVYHCTTLLSDHLIFNKHNYPIWYPLYIHLGLTENGVPHIWCLIITQTMPSPEFWASSPPFTSIQLSNG